jgi:hypothetical protein
MARAACRDDDPEEWFPVGDGETRATHSAYALYVCRNLCKVRAECAQYVRDSTRRPVGIWAGVDMGDSASHAVNENALAELKAITDGVNA